VHEHTRDAEIAQLRAQTSATAATLQIAISQLSNLQLSPALYNTRPLTSNCNLHPIVTQLNLPKTDLL
jgi:hypothetical protein